MSEKVSDIQTTDKNDNNKSSISLMEQYKYYIVIAIFFIFLVIVFILVNKSDNKTTNTTTTETEGYKPNVTRTDPYDEYDIESDIDKLLDKQEKYLNTINKY